MKSVLPFEIPPIFLNDNNNPKYYEVVIDNKSITLEQGGCGQCKKKYNTISALGMLYDQKHVLIVWIYITPYYVLCECPQDFEYNDGKDSAEDLMLMKVDLTNESMEIAKYQHIHYYLSKKLSAQLLPYLKQ